MRFALFSLQCFAVFCFFFVFLVFFWFFQAPREGCRELSLFMPQGKDAESWVLSFVFLLASQCICQNGEYVKRSAKSALSQPPVLESGGLWECFFSLMLHQDIIYMPAMLLQDLIYMIYIYICIPQKFHPAASQETKHIAHAQRETK